MTWLALFLYVSGFLYVLKDRDVIASVSETTREAGRGPAYANALLCAFASLWPILPALGFSICAFRYLRQNVKRFLPIK